MASCHLPTCFYYVQYIRWMGWKQGSVSRGRWGCDWGEEGGRYGLRGTEGGAGGRERNEGGQRLGLLSILIPHAAVEIHGKVHMIILDIFTN